MGEFDFLKGYETRNIDAPTTDTGYLPEPAEYFEDRPAYEPPPPPEPEWGVDFGQRVEKSVQESFGLIWGGLGAASASMGMEGARDYSLNRSNELFEMAAEKDIVTTQFAEISNVVDLAKFTTERVIEFLPDLALMSLGGAGAMTLAGKAASTSVAKGFAKTAVRKALKENLRTIAKKSGGNLSRKELMETAYKTTIKEVGAMAGVSAYSGTQMTGGAYLTDVEVRGVDDASPGAAFVAGAAGAAIEMINPFNKALAKIAVGKKIKSVTSMTVGEAVEEIAQGGVEKLHLAGIDPDLTVEEIFTDPQTYMELAEAGFVGLIVGGVYGGAAKGVWGEKREDGDLVQDPNDVERIDESPNSPLTPHEIVVQNFGQVVQEYNKDTKSIQDMVEAGRAKQFESEARAETYESWLNKQAKGKVGEAQTEASKEDLQREVDLYDPSTPITPEMVEESEQRKADIQFEEKAQEDTYNAWFDRFAPGTIRKKEITRNIAKAMAEVDTESNNLPTQVAERNKAIKKRDTKIESIVKQVTEVEETKPKVSKAKADKLKIDNELVDQAKAMKIKELERKQDIADAMKGPDVIEKGKKVVDTIKAEESTLVEKELSELKNPEPGKPTTNDPHIQLLLDDDTDGLIEEIRSFGNPTAVFEEVAKKAADFSDKNPTVRTRFMEILADAQLPSTKRKAGAKTGELTWDVDRKNGISETTHTNGKKYSVIETGKGHVLIDSDFVRVSDKVYDSPLKARADLEVIIPVDKKKLSKIPEVKQVGKKWVRVGDKSAKKYGTKYEAQGKKRTKTVADIRDRSDRKAVVPKSEKTKRVEAKEPTPEVKNISVEQYLKDKAKLEEPSASIMFANTEPSELTSTPSTAAEAISQLSGQGISEEVEGVFNLIRNASIDKLETITIHDMADARPGGVDGISKVFLDGKASGLAVAHEGGVRIFYKPAELNDTTLAETLAHEILHGVTLHELQNNPAFARRLDVIRQYTIKKFIKDRKVKSEFSKIKTSKDFLASPLNNHKDAGILYSLINNEEFIVGIHLNKGLRKVAASINAPKKSSFVKNVLDYIADLINRVILRGKSTDIQIIKDVMDITKQLVESDVNVRTKLESSASISAASDTYKRDTAYFYDKSPKKTTAQNTLMEVGKAAGNTIKKYGMVVSERLGKISPELKMKVREMDFATHRFIKEQSDAVEGFIKESRKLKPEDQSSLTKSLMNGKTDVRDIILGKRVGLRDSFDKVITVLKNIQERSLDVGLLSDSELIKNYFPRLVKDMDGLIKHYHDNPDEYGNVAYQVDQEEKRLQNIHGKKYQMSPSDKDAVVTKLLMSGNYTHIPSPGSTKARKADYVSREATKFYYPSQDALIHHIAQMNDSIEGRKLIGKSTRPDKMGKITGVARRIESLTTKMGKEVDGVKLKEMKDELSVLQDSYQLLHDQITDIEKDLTDSVSSFIQNDVPAIHQEEAVTVLRARLKPKGPSHGVGVLRDIAYLFALGSPTSAITQLGDTTWSLYRNNTINTFRGAARAIKLMIEKKNITRTDFDFSHARQEMSGVSPTKWLDIVLTWTGLKHMDLFGKETAIQSSMIRWKKMKKDKFVKEYTKELGVERAGKVWEDIKAGNKTEDVLFTIFNDLSNFQPISMSEMPVGYLEAGNMRIFYMLKTFAIKAINNIVREVSVEYEKGNKLNAAKKLTGLVFFLSLTGAGADELKDILMGKESELNDNIVDNALQLFFLNRYGLERGINTGSFMSNMIYGHIPPVRFADDFVDDIWSGLDSGKDFKMKTLRNVPVVGRFAWNHLDYGREAEGGRRRKDVYDKVRETVSGGTSSREMRTAIKEFNIYAREYNKGKKADDKIKPISSTNIKNLKRRERKVIKEGGK